VSGVLSAEEYRSIAERLEHLAQHDEKLATQAALFRKLAHGRMKKAECEKNFRKKDD
jgi:hypothetical protein